jgi:diguanylate cyclase (GGDEF)-like protein
MENAQGVLQGREVAVITMRGDEVRAHGSPGIPDSSLRRLEEWASANVRALAEPTTLPSLNDVPGLAELPGHPETPLGAVTAAPLTFRGERLGVLLALAHGADAFLPKETALLEVYAAEAAIALANARLVERLESMARHDSLTGLLNHGEFQEALARALERAQRERIRLSIVIVDLDGFKQVNDEFGHAEGDRVLRMVADKIRLACAGEDTAARIGGDEFALILPRRTAAEAEALAAHIEREVTAFGLGAGASWGVAEWPAAGPSQSLLLFNADRALYETKLARRVSGRRRSDVSAVSVADPAVTAAAHRRGLTAALARAVDAKDSYTRSHCETVAELCTAIGNELGLEARRVRKLRLAGLLHDVGKIGIADAILQKPSALSGEEFEVMKTHSTLGYSILYAAELFEEAQWVLHHHERIDGRGYPDGIAREEIPLESRVTLVADAFEAMTSDRPYRRGRPESEALAELHRHAGTQFDTQCVAALTRVLERDPQWTLGEAAPAV